MNAPPGRATDPCFGFFACACGGATFDGQELAKMVVHGLELGEAVLELHLLALNLLGAHC